MEGLARDYRGERFARRLRLTLSTRLRVAWARLVFERFEIFRLERFPSLAGMWFSLVSVVKGGGVSPLRG